MGGSAVPVQACICVSGKSRRKGSKTPGSSDNSRAFNVTTIPVYSKHGDYYRASVRHIINQVSKQSNKQSSSVGGCSKRVNGKAPSSCQSQPSLLSTQ
jgi:hypothetical protein